jgi:hypothetical protein
MGTREVMVRYRTSAVPAGAPAQPALRVSFTTADNDTPVGMGWWGVTPDQVGTGSGQTPTGTNRFATC